VFAVNEFLTQAAFLPKGARLVSARVHDGLAELDFSPEVAKTYGTDDERTLVNGILTAVGQFPEIKSATFLSGGKPIDSLGNIDLSEPQPVQRPDEK
jgi:hypothetical protein